jgi:hypothetical protein
MTTVGYIMRFILLIMASTFFHSSAIAQWYQAQGHAYINDGDHEIARTAAMENALKKALLVAGASVSSVKQVVNGLLTQDEIKISAMGSVHSFELLSENHHNNMVSVTIRADIFPQQKQCYSADYKKSILLTKSHIVHREQANIGAIYALDTAVIKKLANKLTNQGLYLETKLALNSSAQFSRNVHSLEDERIKQTTLSLAQLSDSQFVLYSQIQDLSFAEQINNSWQFWQKDIHDRHFKMELFIYNATNGELVFTKSYRRTAPWEHDKRAIVDINSASFWQSQYGQIIEQSLGAMVADIDEIMMCQPSRAKILRVDGNEIMINLGDRHGVKKGDEFSLMHVKNFTTDNGKLYAGFDVSPSNVIVMQVTGQTATAKTQNNEILTNIQIDDIAVRY